MALGKKTLYFMVPANICLWGYIGYILYSNFKGTDIDLPIKNPITKLKINDDTGNYRLLLDYPDPFLKEEPASKPKQNNLHNQSIKALVVKQTKNLPKPTPPTKEIKYLGLIQNKSSGITTALISINGTSYIIKKGEVIDGVNFESITDQIITAKIGKEKITITKS